MVGAGEERAELSHVLKIKPIKCGRNNQLGNSLTSGGIQGALCLGRCFRVLAVEVAWGQVWASRGFLACFPLQRMRNCDLPIVEGAGVSSS